MRTHLHATDSWYEIGHEMNSGLPKACEPTSLDGHTELDPETPPNTLPPTVVRETGSRSEKAR